MTQRSWWLVLDIAVALPTPGTTGRRGPYWPGPTRRHPPGPATPSRWLHTKAAATATATVIDRYVRVAPAAWANTRGRRICSTRPRLRLQSPRLRPRGSSTAYRACQHVCQHAARPPPPLPSPPPPLPGFCWHSGPLMASPGPGNHRGTGDGILSTAWRRFKGLPHACADDSGGPCRSVP